MSSGSLEKGPAYRVEQCPTRKPYLTTENQVAVPLWIQKDGRFVADVTLLLCGPLDSALLRLVGELLAKRGMGESIAAHALQHPAEPHRAKEHS